MDLVRAALEADEGDEAMPIGEVEERADEAHVLSARESGERNAERERQQRHDLTLQPLTSVAKT